MIEGRKGEKGEFLPDFSRAKREKKERNLFRGFSFSPCPAPRTSPESVSLPESLVCPEPKDSWAALLRHQPPLTGRERRCPYCGIRGSSLKPASEDPEWTEHTSRCPEAPRAPLPQPSLDLTRRL